MDKFSDHSRSTFDSDEDEPNSLAKRAVPLFRYRSLSLTEIENPLFRRRMSTCDAERLILEANLSPHVGAYFMPLDEIALKQRPIKRRNSISEIIYEEPANLERSKTKRYHFDLKVEWQDLVNNDIRAGNFDSIVESPEEDVSPSKLHLCHDHLTRSLHNEVLHTVKTQKIPIIS